MCGGVAVPVSPPAPALNDLEQFLNAEKVRMIMCDNRLFEHGNYASYYGAAVVAVGYRSGRGGVLITAYENTDTELSIRENRRWIASLLHSSELSPSTLHSALLQADHEARNKIMPRERIPYRTIMTIKDIVNKGEKSVVKVVMSQWEPRTEVGFPLDMLPQHMRASALPGNMFIAQVNVEAKRAEDIYFYKFELPNPDAIKKTEAIFTRT
jgi:hypothetical protein